MREWSEQKLKDFKWKLFINVDFHEKNLKSKFMHTKIWDSTLPYNYAAVLVKILIEFHEYVQCMSHFAQNATNLRAQKLLLLYI